MLRQPNQCPRLNPTLVPPTKQRWMSNRLQMTFMPIVTCVLIVTSIVLAGCSSASSQSPSSSSGQQSVNQSTQQSGSENQGAPDANGHRQRPDNSNMTAMLTRAAEILGISSDEFIAAFQDAMPEGSYSGSGQGEQPGVPPSGEQGQPPERPAGEQGEPPPDNQNGQPSGEQASQPGPGEFMTAVYDKMAAELGISADDIAAAITQAREELQKQ